MCYGVWGWNQKGKNFMNILQENFNLHQVVLYSLCLFVQGPVDMSLFTEPHFPHT